MASKNKPSAVPMNMRAPVSEDRPKRVNLTASLSTPIWEIMHDYCLKEGLSDQEFIRLSVTAHLKTVGAFPVANTVTK
jgi:hypothetical protein